LSDNNEVKKLKSQLKNKDKEIEQLRQEIDETNKGIIALYIEIDNRKREVQSIFDGAADAMMVVNPDCKIQKVNNAMESLLELKKEKIEGACCSEHFTSELCEQEKCLLKRIMKGENKVENEIEITTKSGKKKCISIVASPLKDQKDNIIGMIQSILDITEKKEIEKERERLQEHIFQSQKMQSIGRLAAGIAHDFNNTLTPMLGYTEVLLSQMKEEDKNYKKLEVIKKGCIRISGLIDHLLSFAQGSEFVPTKNDINDIIGKTINFTEKIFSDDVKIKVKLKKGISPVLVDYQQMQQMFNNLLLNAYEAIKKTGTIEITTSEVNIDTDKAREFNIDEGLYIKITISDTGKGMPENILDKIFEPFFTTKDVGEGSGLGLSTVYGIIQNHKGNIKVDSKVGEGSTFAIYLPAYTDSKQKMKYLSY